MKEFKETLIRKGLKQTTSGSDCFLVVNRHDNNTDALSASELYAKKELFGIELNKIYESRRRSDFRANWVAKLNIGNDSSVDVFKVNSYRVDFDGNIGLEFVETNYGNNQFQVYLPYNYRLDTIDINHPVYILNARTRLVIVTDPRKIQASINKAKAYFNDDIEKDDEKSNWIAIDNTIFDDFAIIDDRNETDKTKNWGSFEHPSKDLMMLIRLLIRAGWIVTSRIQEFRSGVYTIEDLDLEVSSSDPYGCEVIRRRICRFTKYSDDLWVEIPITSEGLTFIRTKEQFVYDACKDPYNKKEYTADIIIRTNTPDEGVYFTGFNLRENYTFTTKIYNAFDALVGNVPAYEIRSLLSEDRLNN